MVLRRATPRRPALGSLFRAGAVARLAVAFALSGLLWAAIVWAGA